MENQFVGVFCAGIFLLGLISTANASLVTRLGGLAVYDTDLDITWLVDANVGAGAIFDDDFFKTDGRRTWESAKAWTEYLTVGGYNDWRLPITLNPDASRDTSSNSSGFNCVGSELGHLFYNEYRSCPHK